MLLFPSRMTMIEHKRKHTKTHKCKICNEGFYTEDRLEKHVTKETHSYPCDQCERSYVNKQSLVRHRLSHSEKTHKCDQCSRAFKTARELKYHVEGMHALSRDFVCDVCKKAFSRPEKLKRHLMIHAPDRPVYTCPFKNHVGCDKTFYRKDKLTRHLYSHSKVKPFKCDQCDKSFARTDNLREHIRSHTGKNFVSLIKKKFFNYLSKDGYIFGYFGMLFFPCTILPLKSNMTLSNQSNFFYWESFKFMINLYTKLW